MNWYLAKIIYRIICGNGDHNPQFDEQLRLFSGSCIGEAYEKAQEMGIRQEELFYNEKGELVKWQFVCVPEIKKVPHFKDGIEVSSRVEETGDAENYINFNRAKAETVRAGKGMNLA
jgi:hypothetical protein